MKVLVLARMTFLEAVRQPAGLVLSLMTAFLMLAAPSYCQFGLGGETDMLRTGLLSTHILAGVVFCSLSATSLFHREIAGRTILSLLTKPVSLPAYYLGRLAGITGALLLFYGIVTVTGLAAITIGVKDTASTEVNLLPFHLLLGGFAVLLGAAFLLNYLFGVGIVSFFFQGWFVLGLVALGITWWLSPLLGLPLPEAATVAEYLKCAAVLLVLLLVSVSLSVALSSCCGPVLNLSASLAFLMLGLMASGLAQALAAPAPFLARACGLFPDLQVFWLAEMIPLQRAVPWELLLSSLVYGAMLSAAFTAAGIWVLARRDYS